MINYIKKFLQNEAYKRILSNILALFSFQGLTYILPLVTFPYLTRVLGPENYGLVAFATAFIYYFQILTDYGFNFSATRDISISRSNEKKISKIFSSVITTKVLLIILSFTIMTLIVFSFDKFKSNWPLYFFTFGLVVGNLLMPSWFFQGMEKMKYISILNIGTTLIYTAAIFIFIRIPSDYIYVPLINSIGAITMGIIAQWVINKNFNVNFILPSINDIKYQMRKGWHLFISTLAISFYTSSNTFILGLFVSSTIVGYYAVAQTIMQALQGLISPIGQAMYPYFSKTQFENPLKARIELKKILLIIGALSLGISIVLVFCAPLIIKILAGQKYLQSIQILQVLVFTVFAVGVSNILGIQGLVAFGYEKYFSKILIFAGIIHIFILFYLISIFGALGAAITLVTTELIICVLMYLTLKKLKIL